MPRRTLLGLCYAFALVSNAQERYGIAHSNYAGTDAVWLNPARSAGQWPYADVRALGADMHVWNSLVAWGARQQRLVGELRSGMSGAAQGQLVLRGMRNGKHAGFAEVNIAGPGCSIALGRGTVGAGVRVRSYTSATGISEPLGNFIFHGLGFRPQHGVRYQEEKVRVFTAAWTEFAINYAHILKAEGFSLLSAGANVHYNLGHAGGALQFDALDYTVVDSVSLVMHEADAAYGFAMPALNAGTGWGADLGVSYERTMEEADGYMPHRSSGGCDPLRYRYRIGLSLLDLGGIRFHSGEAGRIGTGTAAIADYTALRIQDASSLDSLLATSTEWSRENVFRIGTPTAVALQYDQRLAERAYVALAAVQNISLGGSTRLRRMNSLSLSPRFETRYFEVALPITIQEYDVRRPSVGFMLRLDGLVVGSDHLFPFVNERAVHTVDLYFRLRVLLHRSPFCKGKRRGSGHRSRSSKDALPCAVPND